MNKVFDEQALLLEIERVFGRWSSHAEVFKGLLEKLEHLEKGSEVPSSKTITLVSGGGACPEQYWGATDEGDSVYVRFRWGGASLHIGNTLVHEKDYNDPYRGYFEDGELEAFVKEAGYNLIKQF